VSDTAGNFVAYEVEKSAANSAAKITYENTLKSQGTEDGVSTNDSTELGADANGIFWIDSAESVAFHLARTAPKTDAQIILNSKNGMPTSLAVDDTNIYVTDQTENHEAVTRVPKTGGNPTVYPCQPGCADIVVDTQAMYVAFTGESGPVSKGGIQKIPLK
jgi:hypothetical protein